MLDFINKIIEFLLLPLVPTVLWTVISLFIIYGLYRVKGKDIPDEYSDMFTYIFLTNYIMIILFFIFFVKDIWGD